MIQSKKLAILLLVVVFLLGAFSGAALVYSLLRRGNVSPAATNKKEYVDVLTEELALMPTQREALRGIVARSREGYCKLREQYNPRCDEIKQQTRAEIFKILDDRQKAKFQAYLNRCNAEKEKQHREE